MKLARNLIIAFIVTLLMLLYTPLIQRSSAPLVVQDQLAKADAIVVFSAGWEKNDKLSQATLEGYNYGIKLFQQNWAPAIVFAGGNLQGEPTEADEMANMAISDGFPTESVIAESAGSTAYENVLFVKKILLDRGVSSVIIVTPPYQSVRIKKMLTDKKVQVISAPVPNGTFDKANGLERLKLIKELTVESVKYLGYRVVGM